MAIHTKCFFALIFFVVVNLLTSTFTPTYVLNGALATLVMLVSLPLAYLTMRRITAPIQTLRNKALLYYSQHHPDPNLDIPQDEFEVLERSLLWMDERIQQLEREAIDYQALYQNLNKELEAKVDQRTHNLEEKNVRLRMITEELGRAFARIDDEMRVLGRMQKSLLPEPAIDNPCFSMRSFYLPSSRAGGDYYDMIQSEGKQSFLIVADVLGHGGPAAFIMGIARSMVHSEIKLNHSPAAVMDSLNRVLIKTLRNGEFVTMFLGRYDHENMTLTYSNAGHPPPLFRKAGENDYIELTESRGLPLGVMDPPVYEETHLTLTPGDRILLYTDGLVETQNYHQIAYGLDRLRNIAESNHDATNEDLLDTLILDLEMFVDRPLDIEPLEDDATIMIVDFLAGALK